MNEGGVEARIAWGEVRGFHRRFCRVERGGAHSCAGSMRPCMGHQQNKEARSGKRPGLCATLAYTRNPGLVRTDRGGGLNAGGHTVGGTT